MNTLEPDPDKLLMASELEIRTFYLNREAPERIRLPPDATVVHFSLHFSPQLWVLIDPARPESEYVERTFVIVGDYRSATVTKIPAGARHITTVEPVRGTVLHLLEIAPS